MKFFLSVGTYCGILFLRGFIQVEIMHTLFSLKTFNSLPSVVPFSIQGTILSTLSQFELLKMSTRRNNVCQSLENRCCFLC